LQTASVVTIVGCYSCRLLYRLTVYSGCKMLASVASTSLNLYNACKVKNQKAPNVARAQCKIFRVQ